MSLGVSTPARISRRGAILIGAATILLFALLVAAALRWSYAWAVTAAEHGATQTAQTHAGLLASELQKYRLLPLVLTEYPEVRAALTGAPGASDALDPKLELLAGRTDAAVIYVLDTRGRAIAASNWRLPTSFVGHRYDFRSYFRDALAHGHAEQFALGAVSHRAGLFLAQRIDTPGPHGSPLGVVVVKVEFDRIERQWGRQAGISVVTDAHDVVILTSERAWRFRAFHPLDVDVLARLRRSVQFGDSPLVPLPLKGADRATVIEDDGRRFATAQIPVPIAGWSLHHLEPLAPYQATSNARMRAALLGAAVLVILAGGFAFRDHERRAMQRKHNHMLEGEVERRTAALVDANRQLRVETGERARADARLRAASEELAQANRLALIGQITAGVAHEVNQPVAAIRTFAENAVRLIERGDVPQGRRNLDTIVGLTERIGRITAELRGFARRGVPTVEPVDLAAAIDGALLLLGDRIAEAGVAIERRLPDAPMMVMGERVRLEQILINLLQNALDALDGHPSARLAIEAAGSADRIVLTIADNGPGIAPEIADTLFTPLVTSRAEGLGLGLGIARNIAREFGGELELAHSSLGGAAFALTLRRPADV